MLRFPQFLLNAFGCHNKFHKGSLLDTPSLHYSHPPGQIYSASSLKCCHPYLPNLYSTTEFCTNLHNLKKRHQHQVQELCLFYLSAIREKFKSPIWFCRQLTLEYSLSATLILLPRFLENENGFRYSLQKTPPSSLPHDSQRTTTNFPHFNYFLKT